MAPAHILVVDDDAAIQSLLTDVLEAEGHLVTTPGSLTVASALLAAVNFDLVLADSFDATGRAAPAGRGAVGRPGGPHPRCADQRPHDPPPAALAAGFGGVLPKPFDLATLEREVAASLCLRVTPDDRPERASQFARRRPTDRVILDTFAKRSQIEYASPRGGAMAAPDIVVTRAHGRPVGKERPAGARSGRSAIRRGRRGCCDVFASAG